MTPQLHCERPRGHCRRHPCPVAVDGAKERTALVSAVPGGELDL